MKYQEGLIIGKFYPLHKGHEFLIAKARQECLSVVVMVVDRAIPNSNIPVKIRANWIRELFPQVTVIEVIQREDLENEDSQGWADFTKEYLSKNNLPPCDAVYSSEPSYQKWADLLESTHIVLDPKRSHFPISGTEIRDNPFEYWSYLSEVVREHFAKRIVVTGAESTGTTTLVKALAQHYHTAWAREYGRDLYEGFSNIPDSANRWTRNDLIHIGKMQSANMDWMARKANKILFCDTDVLTTMMWAKRYNFEIMPELQEIHNKIDAYILTGDEIPFVQDGFRNDPLSGRAQLQEDLRQNIQNFPHIEVHGNKKERLNQAIAFVDSIMPNTNI